MFQYFSCFFPISILTSILLVHDTKSCWYMSCPAGAFSFVDRLATRSTCLHILISDVFVVDSEIKRNWRHHDHRNRRGVNTALCLSFGHSNNFVYSWLALHYFVSFWPDYFKVESPITAIDVRILYRLQDLCPPSHVLAIAHYHITKILNKQARLRTTCSWPKL